MYIYNFIFFLFFFMIHYYKMIDIQKEIIQINNLSNKNINEKKISLENLIYNFNNENNQNTKTNLLYLIHYYIHKYPELKYFYKFIINYNKSNEKIAEFFS